MTVEHGRSRSRGSGGPNPLLADILPLLESMETDDRREGARRAGELLKAGPGPSTIGALAGHLDRLAGDTRWEVRFAVAHALQYLRDDSFDAILGKLIDDSHVDVKNTAAKTLKRRRRTIRHEEKLVEDIDFALGRADRLRSRFGRDVAEEALLVGKGFYQAAASETAHDLLALVMVLGRSLDGLEKEFSRRGHGSGEFAGAWREHMENATRRCRRIEKLARDLMTYADRSPPEFTRERVLDIVNEAVKDVRDRFGPDDVDRAPEVNVVIDVDPDIQIDAPRPRLLQALTNIVRNGFEAVEKKGRVVIKARAADSGELTLSISDDGIGIQPEDQQRVFLPGMSSKKKRIAWTQSNGMGLAIAHRVIVDDCGGRIDLESQPRKGTTIRIVLPLRCDPEEDE